MTELTGKQVLALLAQDVVPEIEVCAWNDWQELVVRNWSIRDLQKTTSKFRIKPTPARRLSVTLSNGEVVSWPEPVREALKDGTEYWFVVGLGRVESDSWCSASVDREYFAFGNVHLTREAAQEHADALRRINTQEVEKC